MALSFLKHKFALYYWFTVNNHSSGINYIVSAECLVAKYFLSQTLHLCKSHTCLTQGMSNKHKPPKRPIKYFRPCRQHSIDISSSSSTKKIESKFMHVWWRNANREKRQKKACGNEELVKRCCENTYRLLKHCYRSSVLAAHPLSFTRRGLVLPVLPALGW